MLVESQSLIASGKQRPAWQQASFLTNAKGFLAQPPHLAGASFFHHHLTFPTGLTGTNPFATVAMRAVNGMGNKCVGKFGLSYALATNKLTFTPFCLDFRTLKKIAYGATTPGKRSTKTIL